MPDTVRLKVFHLDSEAQSALSQLFELRLDEIWAGGLHTCLGQDMNRACWLRFRLGDEQWIEISVARHQFKDGFTVGSLAVQEVEAIVPRPDHCSWISLPVAARLESIDIYEQRELIDIVASDLDIPSESLNYDALLVLQLDNGSAIMLGMEQDFVDGELVVLQTDQPEEQIGPGLRLRRTLESS
ncbi:hypothetical protein [Amphritea japonica]|uniref:Uncharacterized protein n=1 Tax=Amphritea japonica ATCC BAA-1530 TaxID=1278309 RepID=A0A7R6PJ22_9GAMM|nr:hypothetical protein [Amphritea japonica]BBB27417.1 hypothetical protein AMJAP_2831 [Amphritea japonica ATCC BAA-1530]